MNTISTLKCINAVCTTAAHTNTLWQFTGK